jgi:hypothetical protein
MKYRAPDIAKPVDKKFTVHSPSLQAAEKGRARKQRRESARCRPSPHLPAPALTVCAAVASRCPFWCGIRVPATSWECRAWPVQSPPVAPLHKKGPVLPYCLDYARLRVMAVPLELLSSPSNLLLGCVTGSHKTSAMPLRARRTLPGARACAIRHHDGSLRTLTSAVGLPREGCGPGESPPGNTSSTAEQALPSALRTLTSLAWEPNMGPVLTDG